MLDAIARTLHRVLISRRHLLEWVTAARAEKSSRHDLRAFLQLMSPAQAITLAALVMITLTRPQALPIALPFLVAWALSPLIAVWSSRRRIEGAIEFAPKDVRTVRIIARRTWRFFETFVGDEDHWLPPDNFQEDPLVIAHRTSPTNIGLLLLSTLSAYDFGYVGLVELLERIEFTFASMEKLQKFRGHFFNWHDTRSLQPLWPHYVSVVDSGNLAGHLIVLKQACLELPDQKIVDERVLTGLADTLAAVKEETSQLAATLQRTEAITIKQLSGEIQSCGSLLSSAAPATLPEWVERFEALNEHASVIDDIVAALAQEHGGTGNAGVPPATSAPREQRSAGGTPALPEGGNVFTELRWWTSSLLHEVRNYRRDLNLLAPWGAVSATNLGSAPDTGWQAIQSELRRVPSLAHTPEICDRVLVQLAALRSEMDIHAVEAISELNALTSAMEQAADSARTFGSRLAKVAQACQRINEEMDFKFLLDQERKVFTIGFNVTEGRHDNAFYDLLASEARLASFIAIAKGDVAQEHWFRMGRQLTAIDGGRALISWTGTMFEYLMALLVMRNYHETLLGSTYEAIIARQIEYGYERGVPWGISESAYTARDFHFNYQLWPFVVPEFVLN